MRWDGRFADGDRVDVHEEMTALVLDVVGRALFGTDLTGRDDQDDRPRDRGGARRGPRRDDLAAHLGRVLAARG